MGDSTRSMSKLASRLVLLLMLPALLAACSAERWAAVRDRDPEWMKQTVAGSRIPRRLDSLGNPATGTQVQTITDEALQKMPGNSLGDKLSGNPGGI